MVILENIDIGIDIDKAILQNIDIDKISNRFKFGISNRATKGNPKKRSFRPYYGPCDQGGPQCRPYPCQIGCDGCMILYETIQER